MIGAVHFRVAARAVVGAALLLSACQACGPCSCSCGYCSRRPFAYDFSTELDAAAPSPDLALPPHCDPSRLDVSGCPCDDADAGARPCYPDSADPATFGVVLCQPGTQTCLPPTGGELPEARWSDCRGAVTPDDVPYCGCEAALDGGACPEGDYPIAGFCCPCTKGDCARAECCGAAVCGTPPPGCACPQHAGEFPTCADGAFLDASGFCCPCAKEACAHPECCSSNVCTNDPACGCNQPGEFGCPLGSHWIGGCCVPCTANDCDDPVCCVVPACARTQACAPFPCKPLPPGCNGMVAIDCDDFPEDCDEPCCPCSNC